MNGHDVSAAFRPGEAPRTMVGLVTGLALGKNTLTVEGKGWGVPHESLELTNYPSTGPIISGPHITPFICQTATFVLPDGTTLGPALDPDCSAATRVTYVYRSTAGGAFKPLPSASTLPADVAMTTTVGGVTVPFVVRVETGTMNRGIYQNSILFDPTRDPPPSPFSPPRGWNKRLIAVHGSGCPGGWYIQGPVEGASVLDAARLAEGYAMFTNTLNHPTNSCNAFLAGETTMMGKEHFIETFGVPAFTVSTGGSGGAYTSLQVGDAFPGLFDGVLISATFPDALSIAEAGLDGHLLTHYFLSTNPAGFSDSQRVAVAGYKGLQAWYDAANQMGRTDPVPGRVDPTPASPILGRYASAVWNPAVPLALRYDPVSNRSGARPTVFDVARNGRAAAPEGDLLQRRLRLVQARREPDWRGDLGVVRPGAGEPGLRRHAQVEHAARTAASAGPCVGSEGFGRSDRRAPHRRTGLMSTTGVPSMASIGPMRRRFPSIARTTTG